MHRSNEDTQYDMSVGIPNCPYCGFPLTPTEYPTLWECLGASCYDTHQEKQPDLIPSIEERGRKLLAEQIHKPVVLGSVNDPFAEYGPN